MPRITKQPINETLFTAELIAEHDQLVRAIDTYTDETKHTRLEELAEAIAERASYGHPEAQQYSIYL